MMKWLTGILLTSVALIGCIASQDSGQNTDGNNNYRVMKPAIYQQWPRWQVWNLRSEDS